MALQATKLSKLFAFVLLTFFLIRYFLPDLSNHLGLIPGRTLPYAWNLLTACFLTTTPYEMVGNVIALFLLARLVEPVYGSGEFFRFIIIVDFMICSTVFLSVYVIYAFTTSGVLLYTRFSGFHGIIAALLVSVKQIMPDYEMKLFGILSLNVKKLPSLVLALVVALAAALNHYQILAFYLPGTYLSWLYLRFFQPQPDKLRGDASDAFKFSSFFPDSLAPAIDQLAWLLSIVTRLSHAGATEGRTNYHDLARSLPVTDAPPPAGHPVVLGHESSEAARKREKGVRALEQRLRAQGGGGGGGSGAGEEAPAGPGSAAKSVESAAIPDAGMSAH